MTHETIWNLEDGTARIKLGPLSGQIDLQSPELGLTMLTIAGDERPGDRLLGVDFHSGAPATRPVLIEHFVRGGDLVATYAQTPAKPVRVQIYWRASLPETGLQLPTIDLQVSVQTSLLNSNPELTAVSTIAGGDIQRLANQPGGQFERLLTAPGRTLEFTPDHGPGCLVFRQRATTTSYAEMIHTADFYRDTLAAVNESNMQLTHQLFVSSLEKGVILRARIRGVFLPASDDKRLAAEVYAALQSAPPPLTT
jgi:hypothetical protein